MYSQQYISTDIYKRNDTYVEIYMVDYQSPVPQLSPPIEHVILTR